MTVLTCDCGPALLAAATLPGLELALYSDTQWATAYLDGRPYLTLQRRRVYEQGAVWKAYTTDGALAFEAWSAPGAVRRASALVRGLRRRAALVEAQAADPFHEPEDWDGSRPLA